MLRCIFLLVIIILNTVLQVNSQGTGLPSSADQQACQNAQRSCADCIQANPTCSWCSDNVTSSTSRCRSSISEQSCVVGFLENPQPYITPVRNQNFTIVEDYSEDVQSRSNIIQLRPQEVNVGLRQGKPQKVNITYRRALDSPLDLYYVMDLSFSMNDDLQQLQDLGSTLADRIQNVTNNVRLGFGAFVDKVMMPYASTVPELLQNPCLRSQNQSCAPVFGFRSILALTENGEDFREAVAQTRISGNIDSPEGGFDALMQIAVCQNQIAWRNESLRVIIFTTDASSHIAMDGKLAAILEINDMQCHLAPSQNNSYIYSESRLLDYPSIGQLKKVFQDNNIYSIFAVTEEVLPLYQDLPNLLDNAFVEALDNDSSNVLEIIERAYEEIRGIVRLSRPIVPSYVDVSYRVNCGDSWKNNILECNNINVNDEVVFEFTFTARGCPSDANQVDEVVLSANQLDRTLIRLSYVSCECNCSLSGDPRSDKCTSRGTFECGLCYCDENFSGQQCQCDASTTGQSLDAQCSSDPSNYKFGDVLCNGAGTCECGTCECESPYYGETCQCQTSGCDVYCGNSSQGFCENCNNNPVCICNEDEGYSLNDDIGDCSCNDKFCIAPNTTDICNGRGNCSCNTCKCNGTFTGQYCEKCEHPECTGIDNSCESEVLLRCARCVYDSVKNNLGTVCQEDACINVEFKTVPSYCVGISCNGLSGDPNIHVPIECIAGSGVDDCDVNFKIYWNSNQNKFEIHVLSPDTERDCPPPPNLLLIVLPVAFGIILLGLIALVLWKIFQTIRDKHEYEQFLEDTKNSQWSKGENPLFDNPTDRIENPAYIGN